MTPRGLLVQLAAMQVAELGLDQILAVLDYERGKMEKKTLQRMKAMIRELSQSKALTDTAPLIEELDRKVEMAATYYR